MTLDEAIKHCEEVSKELEEEAIKGCCDDTEIMNKCTECAEEHRQLAEWLKDYKRLLEQERCDDCISRKSLGQKLQAHHDFLVNAYGSFKNMPLEDKARADEISNCIAEVVNAPSVTPQQKMGYCKDCKYFEYDSVTKVNGIPLIIAHEICKRWGGGCKTREDGCCFLFESKMQEVGK